MDLDEIVDTELEALDPYDLMDIEAGRIDAYLSGLATTGWSEPTPCAAWDRHDVAAHLAASEEYNHATLDDTLEALFARFAAAGVTDLHSANQLGVDERRDRSHTEVLDEWRTTNSTTRALMRSRDGDEIATTVGQYPARWQAFHLAAELAVHADDLGVPETPEEAVERLAWRTRVARFIVAESHPEVTVKAMADRTAVGVDATLVELDGATFVAAATGRLAPDSPVPVEVRRGLASVG